MKGAFALLIGYRWYNSVMHPYLSNLQAQDENWPLPPSVFDPSWELAFDAGSELQRRNIARHWLYSLNTTLPYSEAYKIMAWLAPCARMYGKIGPYIDIESFEHFKLNGSLDSVVRLEQEKLRWIHEPHKVIEVLYDCWARKPKDIDSFRAMTHYIIEASQSAREGLKSYYPILQHLLWQNVQDKGSNDENWLKLAILMSLQCGFDKVPNENTLFCCDADKRGHAWHFLAYSAKHGTHQPKRLMKDLPILALVKSTPAMLRVEIFDYMLEKVRGTISPEKHMLAANTVLNISKDTECNIYSMLRRFIPEYTSLWDVNESLEIPYTQAFSDILSGNIRAEPFINVLPQDLGNEF